MCVEQKPTVKERIQELRDSPLNELIDQLEVDDLQALTEWVIKLYALKLEAHFQNNLQAEPFMPIAKHNSLPETETMLFINGLMEVKHIELFELQLFKTF